MVNMGSALLISRALMKRNLRMTILMGIIFCLCLSGLISALAIQMSTYNVFDKTVEKNKAPHLIRYYNGKVLELTGMEQFLKDNLLVESYYIQPVSECLSRVQVGEYDDIMVSFEEYSDTLSHDKITVTKGEVKDAPGINEVWVPTGLSYRFGIDVGDKMIINSVEGKKECEVSAIVLDALFTASMISPARVWTAQGQLSLWQGINEDENILLSVRLKDLNKLKEFKGQLDLAFPELVSELSADYFAFKMVSNLFNDIISIVLLISSIILVLISGGIIFFVISGEIINDYTYYGVYKGLGFSNRRLKVINYWRYLLLLGLVIPIGFMASWFITSGIINQYEIMTGIVGIEVSIFIPLILALFIIVVIIIGTVTLAMRRLKKLEPAKAIRFGYTTKEKIVKRRKMLPNMIIDLALREMRIQPLKSVMKIIIISGLAIMFFAVNSINSSLDKSFNADVTLGAPECDILLQKNNSLINEKGNVTVNRIKKIEGVTEVTPNIISLTGALFTHEERISLMTFAYDNYDDHPSLKVLEGRNPRNDFEAAISKSILERLDKKIGDMITLNVDGSESVFMVTGTFQIMSNMGQAVRITKGAYETMNPNSDYNWFAVSIDEGSDVKAIKSSLQKEFGGQMTVSILDEFIDNTVGGITQGIVILNIILLTIMTLICGTSLFNMIQLLVIENKKNYGILKGLGMSQYMVNRIQYIKMLTIATVGIVIGFSAAVIFTPGLLSAFLAPSGLHHVDVSVPLVPTILTASFLYLLTLASTYFAVRKQSKTDLRKLIIE